MQRFIVLILGVAVGLIGLDSAARADVKVNNLFTDHMVLQQEMPIPVWGTAEPGEEVTVTFGDKKASTKADDSGKWMVKLGALKASNTPTSMTVAGKNTVTAKDVLVGEVWLCSGQSNMEFTVSKAKKKFAGTFNEEEEIKNANWPEIREFTVKLELDETPRQQVNGKWAVCSPKTVGDFSAVGYFMARELHKDLKVPVGIINTAFGASTAQAWISKEMLESDPKLKPALDNKGKGPKDQHGPMNLFNAMLNPLIPYAIRGAAWYQGESITTKGEGVYALLVRSLIKDWRSRWNEGDFPFIVVQLAAMKRQDFTKVRDEQYQILTEPKTYMTVSLDIGHETDVHPHNKQEFGRRLALVAEREVYDKKVVSQGPIFDSMKIEGDKARIQFKNQDGKLMVKGDKINAFEIAGKDGKYVPADAKIDGDTVVVSSPDVPDPVEVRYAWTPWPEVTLFNEAGLPAWQFRTKGPQIPAGVK